MRIGKLRIKFRYLVVSLAALSIGFGLYGWFTLEVPSFAKVRGSHRPSDVWIVDRSGEPLESVRTRDSQRSLDWVKWEDVSASFQDLLVQTEDRRFYFHPGVDPLALAKALLKSSFGRPNRGASTLTMQLVGLTQKSRGFARRNLMEKAYQIFAAIKLETFWSKSQIAEAYINLASFRGELVGLRAASQGYFGKHPSGLQRNEAALLIALLRAPNAKPEVVAKRACILSEETDCSPLIELASRTVAKPYLLPLTREVIPVLSARFVDSRGEKSVIHTSLDQSVQVMALATLREQLRVLRPQNVKDGAVLILETKTGRVVAYAANAGSGFASASQTDGISMRRQAGSTIKPFVYATAFDWRLLNPDSLLEDTPADFAISQGRVYRPRNYDETFRGLVSVGDALGSSMNVPAVRALMLVGEERVLDRLRDLGIVGLQPDDYYGPSLALGSVDLSIWDLTHAYRKLAADEKVFTAETRAKIFNILASPEHRRFTFGLESLLSLPFPAAVKTGTSKDMRDNWCLGWTEDYTVGVWVGNFDGQPMWNVSGMSGAAPIWRSLMLRLRPNSSEQLRPAAYVEPNEPLLKKSLTHIRYPAAGMLVGLDPDIPARAQKLPIEIENPQKGHRIYLNDRLLGTSKEALLWPLRRGKFVVKLTSQRGDLVDQIRFEVR